MCTTQDKAQESPFHRYTNKIQSFNTFQDSLLVDI